MNARPVVFAIALALTSAVSAAVPRIVIDVPETVHRTVAFQGTVSAWDENGQVVPSYTGTVSFRATDGIVLPPDYTFTPADNGTHTFTFTANIGGYQVITAEDVSDRTTGSSDSFYVDCPELTASATNGGPVCNNGEPGDGTILFGSSNQTGVTWYWTGPHTWFSTEQNPTVTHPGQYFLEVRNGDGCNTFATTTVGEKAKKYPAMSLSGGTYMCAGNQATATLIDAADYSNIVWSVDGAATLVSGQGTPSIEFSTSGSGPADAFVNIEATYNASGCHVRGSTAVSIAHRPAAGITAPASSCPDAVIQASVPMQAATYHWTVTHGTIVGDGGWQIAVMPDGTGDVTVAVSVEDNASHCIASDSVVVAFSGPTAMIPQNDLVTCPNQSIDIPVVLSGAPPFTIAWSDGMVQSGIMSSTAVRNVGPSETTSYALASVSDANCGGSAMGAVTISVEPQPAIVEQPRSVAIARGQTATLTVTAHGSNLSYFWYQGAAGDRSHPVASGRSFTTPALSDTARYWVEVQSACGVTPSTTAIISVSEKRRAARHP